MRIRVDYLGCWGLGDALCSDPMFEVLTERHGPHTSIHVTGRYGNVVHNPFVRGATTREDPADLVIEVRGFDVMPAEDYARLEALPSLIAHMCSYAEVDPGARRPRLYLGETEREAAAALALPPRPRIAICADHLDPLRHWPPERWHTVAAGLARAGAGIVEVGAHTRLGVGLDLVGRLDVRTTAAVLERCDLFLGHNSGLFHYAQAAGVPCVILFSLARPERFVHPGARVTPVQARWLPCIDCMTRRFAEMQRLGCIAAPPGRCMLEIEPKAVLEATAAALRTHAGVGV